MTLTAHVSDAVIAFTGVNRRIYTFLKQSGDFHLVPAAQQILNLIEAHSPLNRYTLLHLMHDNIPTVQKVNVILAEHDKLLIHLGFIKVEEYLEWKQRIEVDKEARMSILIVPSGMGGFSVKYGDMKPFGHWPTMEAVRQELHRYGLDENPPTNEVLARMAQGI